MLGSLAGVVLEDRLELIAEAAEMIRRIGLEAEALARDAEGVAEIGRLAFAARVTAQLAGERADGGGAREIAFGRGGAIGGAVDAEWLSERGGAFLRGFGAGDLAFEVGDSGLLGGEGFGVGDDRVGVQFIGQQAEFTAQLSELFH